MKDLKRLAYWKQRLSFIGFDNLVENDLFNYEGNLLK
jgi:hypothetical protein